MENIDWTVVNLRFAVLLQKESTLRNFKVKDCLSMNTKIGEPFSRFPPHRT